MRYKVKLNKTNVGYAIWCPALPGCWTLGATEEEALENIKGAIKAYLETVDEVTQNAELRYVEVR
ncbi:MAG: type II toxin-antitoxin system HicB family antitoxin [Mojavia pulchra JT2-VF2]|jgi:predicted RNase H-like HicB family nuclease|uniref:Type II toxin-antitoxin system HicB family antitoxin n=1 Tax=Mojavia pulchra JT2-VF2 TaxID=287848 RepID=A0A951UGD0_9NOST|nr:type II toxin-antitoxin system HicB family antitoxin [Mojavia pulchra JT2-VF2]